MTRDPAHRWSMARVRDYLAAGPAGTLARRRARPRQPRRRTTPGPTCSRQPCRRVQPVADPPPPPAATVPMLVAACRRAPARASSAGCWSRRRSRGRPHADSRSLGDDPHRPPRRDARDPQAGAQRAGHGELHLRLPLDRCRDPETSFRCSPRSSRQESGGIEGYRGFWDTVDSAELQRIQADPEALTVDYTVDYVMDSSGPGPAGVELRREPDAGVRGRHLQDRRRELTHRERQRLVATHEVPRGEGAGRGVDREVRAARQQLLEHHPRPAAARPRRRGSGGRRSRRSRICRGAALDVELLGVGAELARVAVGGAVQQQDLAARRDRRPSSSTSRVVVRARPCTGLVEPQQLLDRVAGSGPGRRAAAAAGRGAR